MKISPEDAERFTYVLGSGTYCITLIIIFLPFTLHLIYTPPQRSGFSSTSVFRINLYTIKSKLAADFLP